MAISDRIKAEAERTIAGMQRFAAKYGDDVDEAEELEHRISRVEASMEGCNGLTPEEKIQKTAENVFELTCAQERSFDSLRREIKITRDQYLKECEEIKIELKKGLSSVVKKIEDSGMDCSSSGKAPSSKQSQSPKSGVVSKIVADHPLLAFNAFIFILILTFVSGHFDAITKLLPWG